MMASCTVAIYIAPIDRAKQLGIKVTQAELDAAVAELPSFDDGYDDPADHIIDMLRAMKGARGG